MNFFGLTFHLYGLLVGIAVVVVISGVEWVLKKEKIILNTTTLMISTVFFGVIGARLYHVLIEYKNYSIMNIGEVFSFWNGGMSIIGAFVGGLLSLVLVLHITHTKQYFLSILDAIGLWIGLGQAIGRWGNYFNQELYGLPTNLPWAITIDPEHRLSGYGEFSRFHPLFLYESLLMLAFFVCIQYLYVSKKILFATGQIIGVYLIYYAIVRFCLEFIRIDVVSGPGSLAFLTTSQISMILLSMVGGGFLIYSRKVSQFHHEH